MLVAWLAYHEWGKALEVHGLDKPSRKLTEEDAGFPFSDILEAICLSDNSITQENLESAVISSILHNRGC